MADTAQSPKCPDMEICATEICATAMHDTKHDSSVCLYVLDHAELAC